SLLLAHVEYRDGEFAQAEGLRFPFPLWHGGPWRRASLARFAGVPHLAVARLRFEEDYPGISDRAIRKGEAVLPRYHRKSRRLVSDILITSKGGPMTGPTASHARSGAL